MSDGLEWLICDEPCKAMDARSGCHCAKARDEITRLKAEVEKLKTCGIAEVAAHNPSVMDWIKHWEDRTLKAEAEIDAVRRAIPDAYILDPPDGGDVSTVEGVTRLKAEVERKDEALLVARDCIEESFSHAKTPDDLLMAEARLRDVDAALTPSQERHLSLNEQAVMHSALRQSVTKEPRT
jgi:uncharacterized small protein (DUF1192 family)